MKSLYQAEVKASGGRNGRVNSNDGVLDIEVRVPKEMGGPGGAYSNPEQLFAAGYAACFDSALQMVARMRKVELNHSEVTAKVDLGQHQPGSYGLGVQLQVYLPNLDKALAQDLVKEAHQVCPYSNATRNNVEVKLEVI